MRQALVAQQRLHSSIFDSPPASWQTRQLRALDEEEALNPACSLTATVQQVGHGWQLAVLPFSSPAAEQQPPCRAVTLPAGMLRAARPDWSPDSTHVALLAELQQPQQARAGQRGTELQLTLLRVSDGASKQYAVDSVPAGVESPRVELEWAPCSPGGRPRLAYARRRDSQACQPRALQPAAAVPAAGLRCL